MPKIIGWFFHRKFVGSDGNYFYDGVSITKVSIVLLSVLKSVEALSLTLSNQGIFHPVFIPKEVYEAIGAIAGISFRDGMATNVTTPQATITTTGANK